MSRISSLEPAFVEEIPRQLEAGKLYISIDYGTVMHLCGCGCGSEVVTPLHPARWSITYDGESVSIFPSVGSWALPCQSHYVIRKNQVRWASRWPKEKVEAARKRDRRAVEAYFERDRGATDGGDHVAPVGARGPLRRMLSRLRRLIA